MTEDDLRGVAWRDYQEEHGYLTYPTQPDTQYEFEVGWYLHKIAAPLPDMNDPAYSADMEAGYLAREKSGL